MGWVRSAPLRLNTCFSRYDGLPESSPNQYIGYHFGEITWRGRAWTTCACLLWEMEALTNFEFSGAGVGGETMLQRYRPDVTVSLSAIWFINTGGVTSTCKGGGVWRSRITPVFSAGEGGSVTSCRRREPAEIHVAAAGGRWAPIGFGLRAGRGLRWGTSAATGHGEGVGKENTSFNEI